MGKRSGKELPKYATLANWIRDQIKEGHLVQGEKINSELELARRFGISRNTVRQAISTLEAEGLLLSRHGSGTYVLRSKAHTGKISTVAFIASHDPQIPPDDYLGGIEKALRGKGYSLMFSSTCNNWDTEGQILEQYLRHPVDGLIVQATKSAIPNPNIGLYHKLQKSRVPFVFLGDRYPQLEGAISVSTDGNAMARQAVDYLAKRGCRKIGGIFLADSLQGIAQREGFSQAVQDNGLTLSEKLMCWFHPEKYLSILKLEQDLGDCEEWMECDAIVCCNDAVGVGLIKRLAYKGYRVPQDIQLISLESNLLGMVSIMPFTGLSCSKSLIGHTAAQTLIRMIQGDRVETIVLPWKLTERGSA